MVNIQLEAMKKMLKPMKGKLNTLLKRQPKELKCFGFEISDIDLAFKKS
jgi:hypothetical protein